MVSYRYENLVFSYSLDHNNCNAVITIKDSLVSAFYNYVLLEHKKTFQAEGFNKGCVPIAYLESTCKQYITEHLKEFFFNHSLITFLTAELHKNKIVIAGEPFLTDIAMEETGTLRYNFSLNIINSDIKHEWKKFPFKIPSRKNYKDLDRQVMTFLQEEEQKRKLYTCGDIIQPSDWVCFSLALITPTDDPILHKHKSILWIRIGREAPDYDAHDIFLNKKIGDTFTTTSNFLQCYFSRKLDTSYAFEITIIDHIQAGSFSTDLFKHHFKIKTLKELHQKFIEIFSFRNDISQRREIVESTFKTLLKYYPISLPSSLIQQQEEMIISNLRKNPDYPVYKAQKDFYKKVTMLAEKQLKETLLIDHIALQEQMIIAQDDIRAYLAMHQRARTKDFIHFDLPKTQISGQEQPLQAGIINQACLREKTLNYIIYRFSHS